MFLSQHFIARIVKTWSCGRNRSVQKTVSANSGFNQTRKQSNQFQVLSVFTPAARYKFGEKFMGQVTYNMHVYDERQTNFSKKKKTLAADLSVSASEYSLYEVGCYWRNGRRKGRGDKCVFFKRVVDNCKCCAICAPALAVVNNPVRQVKSNMLRLLTTLAVVNNLSMLCITRGMQKVDKSFIFNVVTVV